MVFLPGDIVQLLWKGFNVKKSGDGPIVKNVSDKIILIYLHISILIHVFSALSERVVGL